VTGARRFPPFAGKSAAGGPVGQPPSRETEATATATPASGVDAGVTAESAESAQGKRGGRRGRGGAAKSDAEKPARKTTARKRSTKKSSVRKDSEATEGGDEE
jgi:hypothetical protein